MAPRRGRPSAPKGVRCPSGMAYCALAWPSHGDLCGSCEADRALTAEVVCRPLRPGTAAALAVWYRQADGLIAALLGDQGGQS